MYRLAYDSLSRLLLVMSTDAFLVETYDVAGNGNTLSPVVLPAQIAPAAIATNAVAQCAFILNEFSGTVTTLPAAYVASKIQTIDLDKLAAYHNAVLKAFVDLFGQFTQYLKDCICHHFLVDCPDDAAQTIYLARIDVKNGQVYNICNFSRRKYVHSFPTVEYWMSVVPILPVLRKLIGDACCTIVQNAFSSFQPAPPGNAAADHVSASSAIYTVGTVKQANPGQIWSNSVAQRVKISGALTSTLFKGVTNAPPAPVAQAAVSVDQVRNQPAENATQVLGKSGVLVVGKERAQPSDIINVNAAPIGLSSGDRVVLVTDANDNVIGYRTDKAVAPSDANNAALNASSQRITELQSQMATSEAAHNAALAQRDQQIAKLQSDLQKLQIAQQAFSQQDAQIAQINAQMKELHTTVEALRPGLPQPR
jgi:hypothetical protein